MVWTTPTPRTTGELITASIWNTDLRDNLVLLKTSIANDGKLDALGGTLRRPSLVNFLEQAGNTAPAGGVLTIDLTYNEWTVTLTQDIASIVFTNSPWFAGVITTCTLALVGTGAVRTMNWGGAGGTAPFFRWSGNQPFVPTCTPADVVDLVTMRTYNGTHWFPAVYGQRM